MPLPCNGLAKLIEECGELTQIAGKKLAYYHTDEHPDGKGSLKTRLEDEMADVIAAMEHVVEALGLDEDRIYSRAGRKQDTYDHWCSNPKNLRYSVENLPPEKKP